MDGWMAGELQGGPPKPVLNSLNGHSKVGPKAGNISRLIRIHVQRRNKPSETHEDFRPFRGSPCHLHITIVFRGPPCRVHQVPLISMGTGDGQGTPHSRGDIYSLHRYTLEN